MGFQLCPLHRGRAFAPCPCCCGRLSSLSWSASARWPAHLGIAAYTVGYLAKIYADLFEGTDPEIIEAVRSTGASKLQLVRFVILPEAANAILAQVLFMLEYNIRASSVLGFVGAGGLGFVIQIYLQSLDYQRLATILLLVLVIVLVMDGISAWLRKRFLLAAQAS